MIRYIVRRIIVTIPVLILVTAGIFALLHLAPGDPLYAILGEDGGDPQVREELRQQMGLDKPVPVQYIQWLGNAVQGDFGFSYARRQPVSVAVMERIPVTLQLTIMAVTLAIILALPLGILSAIYRGSWIDLLTGVFASLGAATPTFWLGLIFILVFSVHLGVLPAFGYVRFTDDPIESIKSLILPSVALATSYMAVLSRVVRGSLLDVMSEDYVRTARSKGLAERVVILKHGLRNALIPVITVIGMQTGSVLSGSVVTETVFALPGIGRLAVSAVQDRDFATIQTTVLFMVLAMLLANLLADISYSFVDPRIRNR